uniref:WD_REPEATS_REGION domain-containing protein n=1 Tax=Caenorhabditis japonica TaxID=281687 RepID=A0A8R1E9Q2_CAEJA
MQMGQKLRTALRGPPVFRDGSKFRLNRLLEGHKDGVWHVVADSSRNVCASASADQTARVWSLETGACLATYMGHTGSVNCVAISQHCTVDNSDGCGPAAGLILATASGDESTHIWRVPSNNENVFRQRLVFENPNRFKSVTTAFPQIYVSSGAHFHDVLFNTPCSSDTGTFCLG